jgi:hypothetical protein
MVFDSMIVSLINRDIVIIRKDIILKTMETMKIWLVEYAPEVPDCRDLSHAHRIVVDGLRFDDSVSH